MTESLEHVLKLGDIFSITVCISLSDGGQKLFNMLPEIICSALDLSQLCLGSFCMYFSWLF